MSYYLRHRVGRELDFLSPLLLAIPHLHGNRSPSPHSQSSIYTDNSLLPHVYAIALYNKERAPDTNEWDIAVSPHSPLPADRCVVCDTDLQLPAKNITHVKDGKLSPAMQDRFLRAEAANNNSFVGLPLFAGAIVRPLYSISSPLSPLFLVLLFDNSLCRTGMNTNETDRWKHGPDPCFHLERLCSHLPRLQDRFRRSLR